MRSAVVRDLIPPFAWVDMFCERLRAVDGLAFARPSTIVIVSRDSPGPDIWGGYAAYAAGDDRYFIDPERIQAFVRNQLDPAHPRFRFQLDQLLEIGSVRVMRRKAHEHPPKTIHLRNYAETLAEDIPPLVRRRLGEDRAIRRLHVKVVQGLMEKKEIDSRTAICLDVLITQVFAQEAVVSRRDDPYIAALVTY